MANTDRKQVNWQNSCNKRHFESTASTTAAAAAAAATTTTTATTTVATTTVLTRIIISGLIPIHQLLAFLSTSILSTWVILSTSVASTTV